MIRFLHAADLHLGAPFSALTPALARQRRQEQLALLDTLGESANAHGCDAVLLAGDLFDAECAAPDAIEALQRALGAIRAPVFISPGNHDFLQPGSPYLTQRWPENVHIFTSDTVSCVELPEKNLRVYGAGFVSRYEKPLLTDFCAKADGMVSILVTHGNTLSKDSPYNPITPAQIAASGLGYLALGHVHQASGLLKSGGTYYAWPGCAMGRGFDECGQKGAYLGEIAENGAVTLEFLPLAGRKYEILRVEAGDDALAAIEAALPAGARDDIYRVILTGEADAISLPALQRALAPRVFSLSLRDETRPRQSLWAGAEDDTLRGLFLQALRRQYDAALSDDERRIIALAARLGTAAMDGREEAE